MLRPFPTLTTFILGFIGSVLMGTLSRARAKEKLTTKYQVGGAVRQVPRWDDINHSMMR